MVADLGGSRLGYVFVAGLNQPTDYKTHAAPWEQGRIWLGSAFIGIPGEPQYGLLTVLNLATGKIAWQNRIDQAMMGGSLATAGDSSLPAKAMATSTPTTRERASCSGSTTLAPDATRRPSASSSTGSSSSPLRAGEIVHRIL